MYTLFLDLVNVTSCKISNSPQVFVPDRIEIRILHQ